MNHIEFEYITEDGHELIINASGKISFETNYGATESNNGYPLKTVTNIKFKCLLDDGTLLNKKELSEDDVTNIEDIIANSLSENEDDLEMDY